MQKNNPEKDLRTEAEKTYAQESHPELNKLKEMSYEELEKTFHELYVHKIELQMQNEELYKTHEELYAAKKRYFELYDMAPVGYCTLNSEDLIVEANLTAADMIGVVRTHLYKKAFSNFITKEDQDIYYLFRKKVDISHKRQSCELRMINSEGKIFWVKIVASSEKNSVGDCTQRVVFSDISETKTIEIMKKFNENLHNLSEHIVRAREDERKVIARDIHDELGQLMTAIKIDLSWLKNKIPADAKLLLPKIDTMMSHIDLGIQCVRDIVAKLRPPILDDLGLEAAMEWHAQKYLKPANIKHELIFKLNEELLSEELNTLLFRIYQEALTNVMRYSKAKKVFISLTQKNNAIILEIQDNGIGISEEQINNPKSLGLIGIRERLRPYRGMLEISGREGLGTTLKASIHKFTKEHSDD
jgi:PAS domain S-box-containing protein